MADPAGPSLPSFPFAGTLPPEFRLAVACSWIAPAPWEDLQNETVAATCGSGVDWEAFLRQVDRHGIAAQALSVLRRCTDRHIPDHLYRALEARNKRTVVNAFVQTGELIRINRLLKAHDIDMIALKGVALSQRLYGSPHVRTSCDIDVLIRPENLEAADKLLAELGYRNVYDLTKRQAAAFLVGSHHFNYCREENGQHLELHWRSHFWSRDDMEELWRNRKTVTLMGEQLGFPDDASLFLFLCDHGSRHLWFRLKWLGDIAMLFSDNKIRSWEAVLATADRLGLRRVLAQSALLVRWLYAIPIPSKVSELVRDEKTSFELAKKAVASLSESADAHSMKGRKLQGTRKAIHYKKMRPALSFSLLLKELAICPTDYQTFPLPDSLFWLYVPLRPVFWFWRHYGGWGFARIRAKGRPGGCPPGRTSS